MSKKIICIVGLGYVGLPLSYLCLEKGLKVYGLDVDKEKILAINRGEPPIQDQSFIKYLKKSKDKLEATTDPEIIKKSDIVIVCVPTPVDDNNYPDLGPLKSAVKTVSKHIREGQLVIIESTMNPGVTNEVVKTLLEKSGLKAGKDFYLSHCPERIDPGNKKWTIKNIPRVFGSISQKGADRTKEFYQSILEAEVTRVSNIETAEAIKVVENTFRDVNIALVNELAKSFDIMGINIVEVIKGAATKPYAFMPHYPGCGVGGHCIPVDPYYLIERGKKEGFEHSFLSLARSINNSMPSYTIERVVEGLNEIKKSVKGINIAVLGLAYKSEIDDMRGSPAIEIIDGLKKMGANITIYDPYILEKSTVQNLESAS